MVVFFLFRDGRDWIHRAEEIIPLSPGQARKLFSNISDTIVANVYGILSVGLAQGILTGIALAIVGAESPLLLGLCAAFASIVPVVGAALVWAPAGLYLIFTGAIWKGVFVLVWGVAVISTADNIIRPWVVSGKVELHPLVLLFFILGGVEAFGFLGLFLGPVIASVLAVLFGMIREELGPGDGTAGIEGRRWLDWSLTCAGYELIQRKPTFQSALADESRCRNDHDLKLVICKVQSRSHRTCTECNK